MSLKEYAMKKGMIRGNDDYLYHHAEYDKAPNSRYYPSNQRRKYQRLINKGDIADMDCPNDKVIDCHCPRCVLVRLRAQMDKSGVNRKRRGGGSYNED